jgi:hypothetical protein
MAGTMHRVDDALKGRYWHAPTTSLKGDYIISGQLAVHGSAQTELASLSP